MPDSEPSSLIRLYCTVKKDELEPTGNGLVCTRCERTLQEIHPDRPHPTTGCAFFRRSTIPVIATSLALSSCIDPNKDPHPDPTPHHEGTDGKEEELIVPGMICPPDYEDGKPLRKSDYPTAERVVGRPKWIVSPYTGKHVDVEGLPAGSLAIDPTSKVEEKKYFVIPPNLE